MDRRDGQLDSDLTVSLLNQEGSQTTILRPLYLVVVACSAPTRRRCCCVLTVGVIVTTGPMKTSLSSNRAEGNVHEQRPTIRLLFLALPLGLGFLLLIVAVVVLSSSSKPKPSPADPTATVTVTAEATPISPTSTPQAQTEATSQPAPTQAPSPAADVVAQVNDQTIGRQALQAMQAADRAMTELLDQPLTVGDDVLDRLVNAELVRQAAQADGFALEEDHIAQQLQDFLATRGKSTEDLESALAANDLSTDDFTAYFGQLLLVDQFSRTQSQAQDVTVSEYLRRLQSEAYISFGPAADAALAQAQPDVPQGAAITPEATPEAPAATPMADVVRGAGTGQYAPLFELAVLNYPAADFLKLEDLVGKPTLLSFWTTWCGYCGRQTPVLVDAHARHGESVQFVGINVKENQQQAQDYVTSNNIRYPIGLDSDGQVGSRYGISGFPTTYFLDAEGRVVARYVGSLSSEQVESYLQQLLAGASP